MSRCSTSRALNVDLLAATTDTGLNGLILQLYGSEGEDLELIASATAQIDPLGLTFGINDVTPVRVDLAEMFDMGGLSPYALLSSIPLRSLLLSLPELAGSSEPAQSNAASAEQRMNAIGAALSSFGHRDDDRGQRQRARVRHLARAVRRAALLDRLHDQLLRRGAPRLRAVRRNLRNHHGCRQSRQRRRHALDRRGGQSL